MSIEWISKSQNNPAITLNTNSIVLNQNATRFFDDSYRLMIGINKEKKHIYIKSVSKEDTVSGNVNFDNLHKLSIKTSYSRITGKKIIDNILSSLNLNISACNKFTGVFDKGEKTLVIDVSREEMSK